MVHIMTLDDFGSNGAGQSVAEADEAVVLGLTKWRGGFGAAVRVDDIIFTFDIPYIIPVIGDVEAHYRDPHHYEARVLSDVVRLGCEHMRDYSEQQRELQETGD